MGSCGRGVAVGELLVMEVPLGTGVRVRAMLGFWSEGELMSKLHISTLVILSYCCIVEGKQALAWGPSSEASPVSIDRASTLGYR